MSEQKHFERTGLLVKHDDGSFFKTGDIVVMIPRSSLDKEESYTLKDVGEDGTIYDDGINVGWCPGGMLIDHLTRHGDDNIKILGEHKYYVFEHFNLPLMKRMEDRVTMAIGTAIDIHHSGYGDTIPNFSIDDEKKLLEKIYKQIKCMEVVIEKGKKYLVAKKEFDYAHDELKAAEHSHKVCTVNGRVVV